MPRKMYMNLNNHYATGTINRPFNNNISTVSTSYRINNNYNNYNNFNNPMLGRIAGAKPGCSACGR